MVAGGMPPMAAIQSATLEAAKLLKIDDRLGTVEMNGFVGDTNRGGSCNFQWLKMIPHCNGTHTECVGHIVNEPLMIDSVLGGELIRARLITVAPVPADRTSDGYRPDLESSDRVIDASCLQEALGANHTFPALVIRTTPNGSEKKSAAYSESNQPVFLTVEAIEAINDLGIGHLLVDIPSIDRMYDQGMLTNHHLFWNVGEGTHDLTSSTHRHKTITEMIFVPDSVADGEYMLNIQIPAFAMDAAPSRPMLYPLIEMDSGS